MIGRIATVAALATYGVVGLASVPVSAAATPQCNGQPATIYVGDGSGSDTLDGTEGPDVIFGGAGDDFINGNGGDDLICLGTGGDTAFGGAGNDTFYANDGDIGTGTDDATDRMTPGAGNDTIHGFAPSLHDEVKFTNAPGPVTVNLDLQTATGEGSDTLEGINVVTGSPFGDTITGNDRMNQVFAQGGNDVIHLIANQDYAAGGAGADTIDGAAGSYDLVYGGGGPDIITAGSGSGNVLKGDVGNDTMTGSPSYDDLDGGPGNDKLAGGDGDDTLRPGPGVDTVGGGPGEDSVAYFASASGVVVDLKTGKATGEGDDTISGVEDVFGSEFADVLRGTSAANYLGGDLGNDLIVGRGGPDNLWGGAGTDTADFGGAATGVTASLVTGNASGDGADTLHEFENLRGSTHADTLAGNDVRNVLRGRAGNDHLNGAGGNDSLIGDAGTDTCSGGAGTDTATSCENKSGIP